MKRKKKIVRYKKPFHMNIGIIIFAVILIYFCIYLISYATDKHIAVYEVQKGQIAQKNIYTGLVLQDETVVYADSAGAVNYYMKEGDKAGKNDLVCSLDKEGGISEKISAAGNDGTKLDSGSLADIESTIQTYISECSDMTFYNVYAFKDGIDAQVKEALYLKALNALESETDEAVKNETFVFEKAPTDGVVAFYTDGYEDVTEDSFTDSMFDPSSYQKNSLKNSEEVSSGQAMYKLCTSEDWKILVPVDDEMAADVEEEDYVSVTFRKDQTTAVPEVSVKEYDGQKYLVLTFNSSMVRFISDRYVELELDTSRSSGLKIPNTAIVEKEFLVIPKDYLTYGDNDTDPGVLKVTNKKGKSSVEFVSADLYYETETSYYVDEAGLSTGDVIQKPDSDEQYTLSKTANLKGVYNINRGYAVFRQIDIIDQNEEYSVLQTGTSYGLSLYDHIALNGNEISEGELID